MKRKRKVILPMVFHILASLFVTNCLTVVTRCAILTLWLSSSQSRA